MKALLATSFTFTAKPHKENGKLCSASLNNLSQGGMGGGIVLGAVVAEPIVSGVPDDEGEGDNPKPQDQELAVQFSGCRNLGFRVQGLSAG